MPKYEFLKVAFFKAGVRVRRSHNFGEIGKLSLLVSLTKMYSSAKLKPYLKEQKASKDAIGTSKVYQIMTSEKDAAYGPYEELKCYSFIEYLMSF